MNGAISRKRFYMPFNGQRLRTVRKLRRLRQVDLATRIGMKQYRISEYENDKAEPMANALGEMAIALQCSTDYLLGISNDIEVNDLSGPEKDLIRRLRAGDPNVFRDAFTATINNHLSE